MSRVCLSPSPISSPDAILVLAQFGLGRAQRQRGLGALLRQGFEYARVAHGGEHKILLADIAFGTEQVNGFEHVVEVMRGFTHAREHDFLHRAQTPR